MARQGFLVLGLAIAFGFVCCVYGADTEILSNGYEVGGAQLWDVTASPAPKTYFQDWANQYKFFVGDQLLFYFGVGSSSAGPVQVSPANYASCTPVNITSGNVVYSQAAIDFYEADLVVTGTSYYIDQDLASCQAGLKFFVNVLPASQRKNGVGNAAGSLHNSVPAFGAGIAALTSMVIVNALNFAM